MVTASKTTKLDTKSSVASSLFHRAANTAAFGLGMFSVNVNLARWATDNGRERGVDGAGNGFTGFVAVQFPMRNEYPELGDSKISVGIHAVSDIHRYSICNPPVMVSDRVSHVTEVGIAVPLVTNAEPDAVTVYVTLSALNRPSINVRFPCSHVTRFWMLMTFWMLAASRIWMRAR